MNLSRVPTGISGFDEIVSSGGGLPANYTYLLMGGPGTGKTTLGLQFLLEGVRQGERVLYITLLQTEAGIMEMAAAHGWDLSGITIRVLMTQATTEAEVAEQTLFPSSEIQLDEVMSAIRETVENVRPSRMVFDSIEQIRLLAGDPVVYRQKVLAFQKLLNRWQITAIFVESSEQSPEFKTLAHGVFLLDMVIPPFGQMRRRMLIEKLRGVAFQGGYHSMTIRTGGIEIYPRLPVAVQPVSPSWDVVQSGIDTLDTMLGGGLVTGTACLVAGETGTGKSTLATLYAYAAARQGQKAAFFLFDERLDTMLERAKRLGMDLRPFLEDGLIEIQQVNIGEISAGEFAHSLRDAVERQGVKLIVLDSLTGFKETLPEEPQLMAQLHEMLAYLGQQGVLTLLLVTEHGLFSQTGGTVDASFIADTIVLIRRFEAGGRTRLALSVPKKRHGDHEKYIRELQITSRGVEVGGPLKDFQGVLTGAPCFVGNRDNLLE